MHADAKSSGKLDGVQLAALNSHDSADVCVCAHTLWMHRSPDERARRLGRGKRYNGRRMTIIQVGVDYGTFIEASFCPQRGQDRRGPPFPATCRQEDVDIGRSARGLKLCVVQSVTTMSVSLYTRPHIPRRCNTLQGRNNSVDSPLRIQVYSRGIRVYLW